MLDFSQKVRHLEVSVRNEVGGVLTRRSQYEFDYSTRARRAISQIMPLQDRHFVDGELFAVMDMNLPEGFLLAQIRERSPKTAPTKMQLLRLSGDQGIGWLGYHDPNTPKIPLLPTVNRKQLLREGVGRRGRNFAELVDAYLRVGVGLSGVQPKIMVPERATIPVPNLLVKVSGDDYPGLVMNEFLCLEVARRAKLEVAAHELSDDGSLLLIDRFDLTPDGTRLGFEDIAALLDLRVGGALSDRKYRGSYEDVAHVIEQFSSEPQSCLRRFFDAVALSVVLRNGDAHLKNFAMLYDDTVCRLAPVYDVVTTTLYPYQRSSGANVTDRTMALKLRRGSKTRLYPSRDELALFGAEVCRVRNVKQVIKRLVDALHKTLKAARSDARISNHLRGPLESEWSEAARSLVL